MSLLTFHLMYFVEQSYVQFFCVYLRVELINWAIHSHQPGSPNPLPPRTLICDYVLSTELCILCVILYPIEVGVRRIV